MYNLKSINLITESQAIELANRTEDNFFDLKSSRSKPSVIEEVAVAFANSEGGEIIIGIEDEKHGQSPLERWKGLENIEKYNEVIHAITKLNPVLDFDYWYLSIKGSYGNYVLCIKINTSHNVHETSSKDVYVRVNAGNLKYKGPQLHSLYFAKGIHSFEDNHIADVEIEEIAENLNLTTYIKDLKLINKENIDFLLKERLIHNESWKPTVASIILFSDNCSSILQQTALNVIRYESIDGDELRDELISTKLFEGNVFTILNESFTYIKEILKSIEIWTLNGKNYPNYPEESIWEILVNCLIHRDYSIQDTVKVKIFDNQISFSSPGKLPGIINVNNILDNRFSRNPKIVRFLLKSKSSPNKELGEGLNTATDKMIKSGLKKPDFEEKNNQFTATLYYIPDLSPEVIINKLKKTIPNGFTRLQARHLFGLDAQSTSNELQKLRERKIIEIKTRITIGILFFL